MVTSLRSTVQFSKSAWDGGIDGGRGDLADITAFVAAAANLSFRAGGAEHRMMDERGVISDKNNITIGIKTWSQILDENKARLQFFREKLEHQVDQGRALQQLQERYEKFLSGVITEATIGEQPKDETGASGAKEEPDSTRAA